MDNFSFFSQFFFSRPFCFLWIEFHCIFSIYCKILTNYVYYYYILFRIVYAVGTSFFFRAVFTSFCTHASLLIFFVCFFILFHSCFSHSRVFGKTLLHEFISVTIFNGTCFFPTVQLQAHNVYSEPKTRNR